MPPNIFAHLQTVVLFMHITAYYLHLNFTPTALNSVACFPRFLAVIYPEREGRGRPLGIHHTKVIQTKPHFYRFPLPQFKKALKIHAS